MQSTLQRCSPGHNGFPPYLLQLHVLLHACTPQSPSCASCTTQQVAGLNSAIAPLVSVTTQVLSIICWLGRSMWDPIQRAR